MDNTKTNWHFPYYPISNPLVQYHINDSIIYQTILPITVFMVYWKLQRIFSKFTVAHTLRPWQPFVIPWLGDTEHTALGVYRKHLYIVTDKPKSHFGSCEKTAWAFFRCHAPSSLVRNHSCIKQFDSSELKTRDYVLGFDEMELLLGIGQFPGGDDCLLLRTDGGKFTINSTDLIHDLDCYDIEK